MSRQTNTTFTLGALVRLTRFWNLVIIGLAQYVTAGFLINNAAIFDVKLLLLSISTVLIAAAGYIINDYYDVKIDLINKPERVVIGKSIARRFAILFHTVLSFSGVGIGFLLSWKIGIINFLSAFLLWLYSNYLKRQPFVGNLTVALLTGLAIELINVLYAINNQLVTIYALFAFFMTLIREIIKDMEDLKGDNSFGCRTLPIIWGIRKTKILVYILMMVFIMAVVALNRLYVGLPMNYFLLFLFLPMGLVLVRLLRADTIKDFNLLSQLCKVIMLLGILTMVFV
jgi:4-hydroxybenzoate polyprenyltransferase